MLFISHSANLVYMESIQSESLSTKIRRLRNERNISQEELGGLVGVSMHTVFRWEKGERVPDANELVKLAKSLGTSVAYLTGEDNSAEMTSPSEASETSRMFGRLMTRMAKHSPDLVLHFRTLEENIEELDEKDVQALADMYDRITGFMSEGLEKRMRKKSRHGEV